MDKVIFNQKKDGECSKCGTKEKKDCCNTEVKYVKVDKFQKSDLLHFKIAKYIEAQPLFYAEQKNFPFRNYLIKSVSVHGPPEITKIPIFIQHCNFRI